MVTRLRPSCSFGKYRTGPPRPRKHPENQIPPMKTLAKLIRAAATTLMALAITLFALHGTADAQGKAKDAKFMGFKVNGQRVVLLFDVSGSVVSKAKASGMPLHKIKEQTEALVNALPDESQFALVQFVRNYKMFLPEMVPASKDNCDQAKAWMELEWDESGMMPRTGKGVIAPTPNGLPAVLRAAYALKPDLIFVISDGSFERTANGQSEKVPYDEFEALFKELAPEGTAIPFNFVGFQMRKEDKDFWSKMSKRLGGELKDID